jgi:flagellar biosynthesis/type III secretory pathway protein FliH
VELSVERPSVAPGTQRLRALDYTRLVQATHMLESAEHQAGEIVGQAETVRDQAYAQGLAEGRQAARQELLEAVAALQSTLQQWVSQTEPQLVAMVLRCVHEVVRGSDPDILVRGSIDRALAEMNAASEIRIKVHESHLATLRAEAEDLVQRFDLRGVLRVESSPSLRPGDCIVESPLGTVDLRVDSQLKFVDQTLKPD